MFITGSSFCIAQVGIFSKSSSSSLGISAWQFSLSCNYNQKMFIRIIETRKMIELGNFTEQKNQVLHRRVICFLCIEMFPSLSVVVMERNTNLMARGLITTKTE